MKAACDKAPFGRTGRAGRFASLFSVVQTTVNTRHACYDSAGSFEGCMLQGLRRRVLAVALVCAASPVVARAQEIIPIEPHGGTYVVPGLINGILKLKFIVDSGAADVSIPAEVAASLKSLGTLSDKDLLGKKIYVLADGSNVLSDIYRISSLKIGAMVMKNVTVRIASEKSGPLLGQSFLNRLSSWSVDNGRQLLIINNDD